MNKIIIDNKVFEYELSRTSKRNINLRIDSDLHLKISAPKRVTIAEIEGFLHEKSKWIIKNVEKQKNNKVNILESGNDIWLKGKQYKLYYKMADKNNVVLFDEYLLVYSRHVDDIEYSKSVLQNWLKERANDEYKIVLDKYKNEMIKKYKIPNYTFQIRDMKSRWGTCTPAQKKIALSLSLMYVPHEYLEYVALHELTHFLEIHHNDHFYSIIQEFMPDYKIRQKTLNKEYSSINRSN